MKGTARYLGERVTIIDVFGDKALVTPGQAHLMVQVDLDDLSDITWIID